MKKEECDHIKGYEYGNDIKERNFVKIIFSSTEKADIDSRFNFCPKCGIKLTKGEK